MIVQAYNTHPCEWGPLIHNLLVSFLPLLGTVRQLARVDRTPVLFGEL
jgi:hypothetical protein